MHLDLNLNQYIEECRSVDNKTFFVKKRDTKHILLNELRDLDGAFLRKLEISCGAMTNSDKEFVQIDRVTLSARGRANKEICVRKENQREGGRILKFVQGAMHVMSVWNVYGVLDKDDEVSWLGFYGPVWKCQKSEHLFEVFEFNAKDDFMGIHWWAIEEVGLPAWVRHRHTFAEHAESDVCERLTLHSGLGQVLETCHFAIECDKHDDIKEDFCHTCLANLVKGDFDPGRETFVQLCRKRGSVCTTFLGL